MPEIHKQTVIDAVNRGLAQKAYVALLGVNTNTTKDDKARLIHVYVDKAFDKAWLDATKTLPDRAAIDDRQNRVDPMATICEGFNDRNKYVYYNVGYKLDPLTGLPTTDPCAEFAAAEQLYRDINPAEAPRPPRDVGWIKTHLGTYG